MKTLLLFGAIALSINAFGQAAGGGVTDYEGNSYETVIIGNQEWMATNLNASSYANGDLIPNITDGLLWEQQTIGSWAFFDNNLNFESTRGKMYNAYTVIDSRNVCPTGWHVPDSTDWTVLINNLGGVSIAGGAMKSTGDIDNGTGLWKTPNVGATNSSNLSVGPTGYRYHGSGSDFLGDNRIANFWSSSDYLSQGLLYSVIDSDNEQCGIYVGNYSYGFAIRCMNDEVVGLIDLKEEKDALLIKITNIMGQEVGFKPNMVLIYMYADGTAKRVFKLEE
jgi:uncharacterized protein (TIGR02145 family)